MHTRAFITYLVLTFLLSSCQEYRTPIINDPFYNDANAKRKVLEEGGEPYTQRNEKHIDKNKYSSHQEESYDEFTARLVNTLATQEYEKDQLINTIEQKASSCENLKKQVSNLQNKHIDLRLTLMRIQSDTSSANSGETETLFKRYIVKEGDTLQKIAYKTYNHYSGWLTIYRFNKKELKYGPNRIRPGQILLLPKIKEKIQEEG